MRSPSARSSPENRNIALDGLISAARDRESPWDAARADRVLSAALRTRTSRAEKNAARVGVAAACGAVLLFGLGLGLGIPAVASTGATSTSNTSNNSNTSNTSSTGSSNPSKTGSDSEESADVGGGSSTAPSAADLASLATLAQNDGGYGRD